MTIQARRLGTRRGHSPLDCGATGSCGLFCPTPKLEKAS